VRNKAKYCPKLTIKKCTRYGWNDQEEYDQEEFYYLSGGNVFETGEIDVSWVKDCVNIQEGHSHWSDTIIPHNKERIAEAVRNWATLRDSNPHRPV
jgi:hypothetical protein